MAVFAILIVALALLFFGFMVWNNAYFPYQLKRLEKQYEKGEYDQILAAVNALSPERKKTPAVQWLLARIYFEQSQYVMSMVALNDLLEGAVFGKDFSELEVHTMLAHIYEKTNKFRKAVEEYEQIAKLEPDNGEALSKIGGYYFTNEEYDNATSYIERAIRANEPNAELLYMLAFCQYKKKNYDQALANVNASLAIDEQHTEALLLRGKLYFFRKDYEDAKRDLLVTYNFSQTKMKSAAFLGRIAAAEGAHTDALRYFEDGLVLSADADEETLEARYLYADLLLEAKRLRGAVDQWKILKNAKYKAFEVSEKIETYTRILSNPKLSEAVETDIEKYLDKTLYKVLSRNGYAVVENRKISPSKLYFLTMKKIGGGAQSYRSAFALDVSCVPATLKELQDFRAFAEQKLANNSFYIAIGGFAQEAKSQQHDSPVEMVNAERFEGIVSGSASI